MFHMERQDLFKHILVPTDGSETSIRAGRMSVQLASIHDARITFVYVVDRTTVEEIAEATSRTADMIRRNLEEKGRGYLQYLARLARNNDVEADQVVRQGVPHSEISELARDVKADLIVIGRVGCRGPRCVLIGSVAERVIEQAPCPVLVVSEPNSSRW